MMLDPLQNPIFLPVVLRVVLLFAAGFLLIAILHRFRPGLWRSNLGKRYMSWLVIGPLYLLAVFVGGLPALIVLALVMFYAIREIHKMSGIPKAYAACMLALGVLSIVVAEYWPSFFYSLPLIYFGLYSLIAIRENDAKKSLTHNALALYVSIWVIFSLAHFSLLGHLNKTLDPTRSLLVLIGFAVPLSDIMAYVVGTTFHKLGIFDKAKIASNISPNKTYAGVLGNVFGAGIGIALLYFILGSYLPWYHWIIISIILGIMGVAGDLTESLFKRHFKAKDSGTLIPGHGGVLDRIDSTLRIIIVLYYYLLIVL